jgi:hypothetical protein
METRNCPLCNAPSTWVMPEVAMNPDARRIVCPHCSVFEIYPDALNGLRPAQIPDSKRDNLVRRSRYFHDAGMTFIITPGVIAAIPC